VNNIKEKAEKSETFQGLVNKNMLNFKKAVTLSVMLVALLSIVAAGTGVLYGWSDESVTFTTVRGQSLDIMDYGIYRYNSVSLVAEGIGWDAVTLFLAVPLLLGSLVWYRTGSIRGKLLLSGTLFYFFYQYLSWSTGWAYNQYFLIYVFIYSLSALAFLLTVFSINITDLSEKITTKFPRKATAGFILFIGGFFLLTWLSRILPSVAAGAPPDLMLGQTTLVTQSLDLGILVPFCLISGILLLKKNAYGILLSSIVLIKTITMSLALIAMVIFGSILAGSTADLPILPVFAIFGVLGTIFTVILFKNVNAAKKPL
jgi:hypothetical protein